MAHAHGHVQKDELTKQDSIGGSTFFLALVRSWHNITIAQRAQGGKERLRDSVSEREQRRTSVYSIAKLRERAG